MVYREWQMDSYLGKMLPNQEQNNGSAFYKSFIITIRQFGTALETSGETQQP